MTGRLRRAAWAAAAAVLAIGVALWLLGFQIYVAEVLFRMLALLVAATGPRFPLSLPTSGSSPSR